MDKSSAEEVAGSPGSNLDTAAVVEGDTDIAVGYIAGNAEEG